MHSPTPARDQNGSEAHYLSVFLKKAGKTFESKSYPGEPHGFRNPANRIDMYNRLEAFFDKYLKTTTSSSGP